MSDPTGDRASPEENLSHPAAEEDSVEKLDKEIAQQRLCGLTLLFALCMATALTMSLGNQIYLTLSVIWLVGVLLEAISIID